MDTKVSKKVWLGPVKVLTVKEREVFVFANGSMKKVPKCFNMLSYISNCTLIIDCT